jgi:hypothetical protein
MKDTLKDPKYKDIKLVKVAYGDDDDQKSFQQMQGLIQAYPTSRASSPPLPSASLPRPVTCRPRRRRARSS